MYGSPIGSNDNVNDISLDFVASEAFQTAQELWDLGLLELSEFNGCEGIWVRRDDDKFFLRLTREMLMSHATYAKYVDSDDPEDIMQVWADGEEDPVQVELDCKSGRIRNWDKINKLLKRLTLGDDLHLSDEVHLGELDVKTYRRSDGTVVKAHKRHHDHIQRFLGIHKTVSHAAIKKNGEVPLQSDEWHMYQHPDVTAPNGKKIPGRPFLSHPETGDQAPPGTVVDKMKGQGTEKLQGFIQSGNFAVGKYDEEARWRDKLEWVTAMIKSETLLHDQVRNDLNQDGWPKSKLCALVTILANRHVFRIGGGMTNMSKGRDAEGNVKEATYEDTFGLTTFKSEHVVVSRNSVMFTFKGKAGVHWERVETDPQLAKMVQQLATSAGDGTVFRVSAKEVRDYLRPYGFSPHRFRTYWASYLFYAKIKELSANGPIPEKQRDKALKEACQVAAEKLNDTIGAVQKNYVVPQLMDQLKSTGTISDGMGFHEYHLSEYHITSQNYGYWLPHEEEYHRWVVSQNHAFGVANDVLLSEAWFSPWPALQPGDHWVTLKPHGPDSDDYRRVIIREHPDGSAHVVWAGHKGLEHLKLTRTGERGDIEHAQRQSNSGRALTTEEKAQQDQTRQARQEAHGQEKLAFGQALANALGRTDLDPEALVNAITDRKLRSNVSTPKTAEEILKERERVAKKMQDILDGNVPDTLPAPDHTVGVAPERALAEASMADLIGELPHNLSESVDPSIREAWNAVRNDHDTMSSVAALKAQYDQRLRDINKDMQVGRGTIHVTERMAFYDNPDANDLALYNQASERARYQMNTRFWGMNSGIKAETNVEPGLGAGSQEHFYQGATDALSVIADKFAGEMRANPGVLQELGPEVVAAAVAATIISRNPGRVEAITKSIMGDIAKQGVPTVAEALAIADDADEERERIRLENAGGMLTDVARVNALKNQTVRKQKAMGRAAGSLESAASVADWLRKGVGDGVTIQAGEKLDAIRSRLESVGLQDGDGYELRHAGNNVGIFIPEESLPRLLQAAEKKTKLDEDIMQIKSHRANTDHFDVPGMKEDIHLKDQQQAVIRFVEKQGRAYANAGVGIGKTITAGALISRLMSQGKIKKSWYIVPTNLLANTKKELEDKFPGLTVAAAHESLNSKAKSRDGRRAMYADPDAPHILLIGQDVIREDAEWLANACDGEHAPGCIIGDEVHAMFTPGDSGDASKQSQRANALARLGAPYMLAMTGTPIRRSSAEVWKVLNWMKPGQYGSLASWVLRYGRLGQGVSAYSDAVNDSFQREINEVAITEHDKPNVELIRHVRKIDLSPHQQEMYKAEQARYDAARLRPGADTRKLSAAKVQRQREVIHSAPLEHNAMLQAVHEDIRPMLDSNRKGLIHCTSIAAVHAVTASFPPGTAITYTGDDSLRRRNAIVQAINDGVLITGGRARSSDGVEGQITDVTDTHASIRTEDGSVHTYEKGDLESKTMIVVGTSTSVGVISTGLNLQKGATWTGHYQLADSAATEIQRSARTYRTGQTHDVDDFTWVAQTPASREHYQRLQEQKKLLQAFDDPKEADDPTLYDEHGLFPLYSDETDEAINAQRNVNLSEIETTYHNRMYEAHFGTFKSLLPSQKGLGSAHRGGKYQHHGSVEPPLDASTALSYLPKSSLSVRPKLPPEHESFDHLQWPDPETIRNAPREDEQMTTNSPWFITTPQGKFFVKPLGGIFDSNTETTSIDHGLAISDAMRETTAVKCFSVLGFAPYVLPTKIVNVAGTICLLTPSVENQTVATNESYNTVGRWNRQFRERMMLADFIVGNSDRHGNNALVRADGSPWLIDHGYCFDSHSSRPQGALAFIGSLFTHYDMGYETLSPKEAMARSVADGNWTKRVEGYEFERGTIETMVQRGESIDKYVHELRDNDVWEQYDRRMTALKLWSRDEDTTLGRLAEIWKSL